MVEQPVPKVFIHLLVVDLSWEGLVLQDCLDLRCEDHSSAVTRVKEWLDAEVVTREDHALFGCALVKNGETPHAVEAAEAVGAPLRVRVQYDLGVAGGVEGVPVRLQLRAQLSKVVDLTVVDHLKPAAVHRHRLVAVLEVDDAQPPESERCGGILEVAFVVRTTMAERLGHGVEQRPVGRTPEARDPAHVRGSPASVVVGA